MDEKSYAKLMAGPQPDGTQGIAAVIIVTTKDNYKNPKALKGCVVKNDDTFKSFLSSLLDNEYRKIKYFLCIPDCDAEVLKRCSLVEINVNIYRLGLLRGPKKYKKVLQQVEISKDMIIKGNHGFLPLMGNNFENSKFLKIYSKSIDNSILPDNLCDHKIFGVVKGEGRPKSFGFKLTREGTQSYRMNTQEPGCLEPCSSLYAGERDGDAMRPAQVIGFYKKQDNQINITLFQGSAILVDLSTTSQPSHTSRDPPPGEEHTTAPTNREELPPDSPGSSTQNVNVTDGLSDQDGRAASSTSVGDNNAKARPSQPNNQQPDESAASSTRDGDNAKARPSQPNNQQPDERAASSTRDGDNAEARPSQPNNQQSDASAQPNITYIVYASGNAQVAVGSNPTFNAVIEDSNVSNQEGAEDAGSNDQSVADQSSEDEDQEDSSRTSPPVFEECQELIAYAQHGQDIQTVDRCVVATRFAKPLHLYRTSMEDPPPKIVNTCRNICSCFKQHGRIDIVKELRTKLPSGMTGPLRDKDVKFENLPVTLRKEITEAITGNEKLLGRLLTEWLNISSSRIGFYKRMADPAEEILDKFCKKRTLLIGDLYDILVKYGASSLADEYL